MKYKDFDNYEIFPYEDKVINTNSGKILKQTIDAKGYVSYRLYKDGVCYFFRAHRLYWEVINGEIPDGMEIDHINTIRNDNSIDNLRIVTHKENMNNPISLERRREFTNSDEHRKKLSVSLKGKLSGEKNPMYGKPRPEGGGAPPKPINAYKNGVFIKTFSCINDAARELGLSNGNINFCLRGIRKHTKGYTFELV